MKFTCAIDKTVATKQGHTIEFQAGVPTHVPKECWREVQAAGAVPENQIAAHDKLPVKTLVVDDPLERRARVFEAFVEIVEGNQRADFGASGAPHHKAVERVVGFDVDPKERDALWVEFQQLSGTGELATERARMKAEIALEAGEGVQLQQRTDDAVAAERDRRLKAESDAAKAKAENDALREQLAKATYAANAAPAKSKARAKAK